MEVGSVVQFGSYPQGPNGERYPLEWIVLQAPDSRALIITKNVIEAASYNMEHTPTTWESSSMRAWLNDGFLVSAFTQAEKERILQANLPNPANARFWTEGSAVTKDYAFCLSAVEVESFFKEPASRRVLATAYAAPKKFLRDSAGSCNWCLRTPGGTPSSVTSVYVNGEISYNGEPVTHVFGIRPALWATF